MVIYKDEVEPKSLDTHFRGHDESRWYKRHSRENGARSEALALSSHKILGYGLSFPDNQIKMNSKRPIVFARKKRNHIRQNSKYELL